MKKRIIVINLSFILIFSSFSFFLYYHFLYRKPQVFYKWPENPIFKSSGGVWDAYGIRDPTFMKTPDQYAVREDGFYIMYYNGRTIDGLITSIGRATSFDGVSWVPDSNNPVFEDHPYAGVASVIKRGPNDYVLYYHHGTSEGFHYAFSNDGISWIKQTIEPFLIPEQFKCSIMGLPSVTMINNLWYMVFEGWGSSAWNIHMAKSENGFKWVPVGKVYDGTPETWDYFAQANPSLYYTGVLGHEYAIFYNGEASPDAWDLGIITSSHVESGWCQWGSDPVLIRGSQDEWDDTRIEGMRVLKDDFQSGQLRVWYFGLPSSNSFRHGAIGYAICYNWKGFLRPPVK